MNLPPCHGSRLRRGVALLLLTALAGCEEMRFGYHAPIGIPLEFEASNATARHCLTSLEQDDARFVSHLLDAMLQESRLGLTPVGATSADVRRRQTQWDHRYCVQHTNCLALERPDTPAPEVADFFERCLDNRAQLRVQHNL